MKLKQKEIIKQFKLSRMIWNQNHKKNIKSQNREYETLKPI